MLLLSFYTLYSSSSHNKRKWMLLPLYQMYVGCLYPEQRQVTGSRHHLLSDLADCHRDDAPTATLADWSMAK